MSRSWKRGLTILLLIVTLVVAGLLLAAWTMLPLDDTALAIDGDRFSLADLSGMDAVVFFIVAVAAIVLAVMVAIAAGAFGIGLGALGLALGVLVTVGTLVLLASPFALCAWLLWRLVRSGRTAPLPIRP